MKEKEDVNIARSRLIAGNLSSEKLKMRVAREKAEVARTGVLFDPKEFAVMFGKGSVMHYFDKIREASANELKTFHKKIRKFKSEKILNDKAFSGCDITKYSILVNAINYELLKRNKFFSSVYNFLLPYRQRLAWCLGHRKVHYHKEFGLLFIYQPSNGFFYKPFTNHLKALWRFWLNNWRWLLSTSGGIGFLFRVFKEKG